MTIQNKFGLNRAAQESMFLDLGVLEMAAIVVGRGVLFVLRTPDAWYDLLQRKIRIDAVRLN
jgi:hypothetical protein